MPLLAYERIQEATRTPSGKTLINRRLGLLPAGNTQAIKDDPRSVGAIERVKVNAGDVVVQKVVALLQGEVNTNPAHHFRIIFASL